MAAASLGSSTRKSNFIQKGRVGVSDGGIGASSSRHQASADGTFSREIERTGGPNRVAENFCSQMSKLRTKRSTDLESTLDPDSLPQSEIWEMNGTLAPFFSCSSALPVMNRICGAEILSLSPSRRISSRGMARLHPNDGQIPAASH